MSTKIGNANYSGGYKKRNHFKLKDGENVYRILPPLGDLAEEGRWSVFWNVHFGYKNSKDQHRPFQSPLVKNKKTKMVEVPDAALERIEKLQAALAKAKADNDLPMIERIGKMVGNGPKVMAQFNMDNNHHMNVIDAQGNIGTLQLRHRCKVALDLAIKGLQANGVDPLSVDNGRFFVITRSGVGLDTTFQVSVLKKKMHIEGIGEVEQDVVHKLTPEIVSRLATEASQLNKLFKKPTAEEVARIVKEGAKAVDEILDAPSATASAAPATQAAAPAVEEDAPGDDYVEPTSKPLATPAAALAATVVQVAQAISKPAPVAPKPAPAVTLEQSDADFLASLN